MSWTLANLIRLTSTRSSMRSLSITSALWLSHMHLCHSSRLRMGRRPSFSESRLGRSYPFTAQALTPPNQYDFSLGVHSISHGLQLLCVQVSTAFFHIERPRAAQGFPIQDQARRALHAISSKYVPVPRAYKVNVSAKQCLHQAELHDGQPGWGPDFNPGMPVTDFVSEAMEGFAAKRETVAVGVAKMSWDQYEEVRGQKVGPFWEILKKAHGNAHKLE